MLQQFDFLIDFCCCSSTRRHQFGSFGFQSLNLLCCLPFFPLLQTSHGLHQPHSYVTPPPIVTLQLIQIAAFACQYWQTVLHLLSVLRHILFSDQPVILPKDFQPTCRCWCWIHSQQLHCHVIQWGSIWRLATVNWTRFCHRAPQSRMHRVYHRRLRNS